MVTIDVDLLGDLMLSRGTEGAYFDTLTGQPEFISDRVITAVLHKDSSLLESLPEDERRSSFVAEGLLSDKEERYTEFPCIHEIVELSWMHKFAEKVSDLELSEELKGTLQHHVTRIAMQKLSARLFQRSSREWHNWCDYLNLRKREAAESILKDFGIEEGENYRFV